MRSSRREKRTDKEQSRQAEEWVPKDPPAPRPRLGNVALSPFRPRGENYSTGSTPPQPGLVALECREQQQGTWGVGRTERSLVPSNARRLGMVKDLVKAC